MGLFAHQRGRAAAGTHLRSGADRSDLLAAHPSEAAVRAREPTVVVVRLAGERLADSRVGEHQEATVAHRIERHLGAQLGFDNVAEHSTRVVVDRAGVVVLVAAQHAGVHRVRAEARDHHAEMGIVEGDPFREAERTVLGEGVPHPRRAGDERRRRDGLHQMAAAALDHARHDQLGGPHVRQQVHVDDLAHLIDRGAEVGASIADAGVRAEDMDRPERRFGACDEVAHRGGIADIAGDGQAADALAILVERRSSRSATTTLAPSAASRSASARPIPWPPPVTTAHLPLRSTLPPSGSSYRSFI